MVGSVKYTSFTPILYFLGAKIFLAFSPVKCPLLALGQTQTDPLVWTDPWSALYWTPDHTTTRKSKRLRIVCIRYPFSSGLLWLVVTRQLQSGDLKLDIVQFPSCQLISNHLCLAPRWNVIFRNIILDLGRLAFTQVWLLTSDRHLFVTEYSRSSPFYIW